MKKAVIYARYSSHNQREESIDAQLRECHDYAKKNDFVVLEEYCDRAISGKTDNRASFQRMIKDAKHNKFNYVLVYKLDRFARNRYDSAMYRNILKKHDIKLISIKENITDNPEGILLESLLEGLNEYYSANLSQNIKRGMTENALKCKFNGSGCPLGFRITPDKYYEIDEIGAKIVKEIFNLYASGKNRAEIIEYCNNKGYKTSKGQAFNKNSIDRILSNDKYIGTYRHSGVVVEKGIPSIIDDFLFNKVQTMLKKNYASRARGTAKADYILSGKLFCGHCGENMIGISGTGKSGKKHYYYKCTTRKEKHNCDKENERKEWLEDVVIKTTVEKVLTDENIELIATKAFELIEADNADTSEIAYYENELKETRKQIKNIVDMIANGLANMSIANKLTDLENYERDVVTNLEYLNIKKPTLTKEQIMYWLESFRYGDADDIEYKRRIVNTLIHSIYVYDNDGGKRKIVINFNTSENNQAETEVFNYCPVESTNEAVVEPLIYVLDYKVFSYTVITESVR